VRIGVVEQILEVLASAARVGQLRQRGDGGTPPARRHAVERAAEHLGHGVLVAQLRHAVERSGALHVGPRRPVDEGDEIPEDVGLARAS